jgi:hypothetical protein
MTFPDRDRRINERVPLDSKTVVFWKSFWSRKRKTDRPPAVDWLLVFIGVVWGLFIAVIFLSGCVSISAAKRYAESQYHYGQLEGATRERAAWHDIVMEEIRACGKVEEGTSNHDLMVTPNAGKWEQ